MARRIGDKSLLEGEAIKPFREAIRSELTRSSYERNLAQTLTALNIDADTLVERARKDPAWAQSTILNYLMKLKEKVGKGELGAGTIVNTRKPLRLLLDMNDVTGINWKKIARFMPSARKYALDRAPTIEEVRLIMSNAELRFQAIILTMVSSGIRLGAWEYLNWGHVEPINRSGRLVAAKLLVYAGEPEEYYTFVTPEAYNALVQYIRSRASHGEKITGSSPLMRDRWQALPNGSYTGEIDSPRRLQLNGVKRLIDDMLWKKGLRTERKKRHEFSIHSFRKFFKTRAEQVMKPINVETLMGHSTGISDSYYGPTEKDLLEDYLNAVPLLTTSEVEEVRHESQLSREQLEGRLAQLETLVSRLAAEKGLQVLALDQSHKQGT